MRGLMCAALAAAVLGCNPGQSADRAGVQSDRGSMDSREGGTETGLVNRDSIGDRDGDETNPAVPKAGGAGAGGAAETAGTSGGMSDAGILGVLDASNAGEIAIATLAQRKAQSPEVKQVARMLVTDHTRNRQQGQRLAQRMGDAPKPTVETGVDAAAARRNLEQKSGADFDRAFLDNQIRHHQAELDQLRNVLLPAARDEETRTLIEQTIPVVEGHLAALQQLAGGKPS
jgi:putative membrane protein